LPRAPDPMADYLAAPTRTPKRAGLHDRRSAPRGSCREGTARCATATVDRAQRHGLAWETCFVGFRCAPRPGTGRPSAELTAPGAAVKSPAPCVPSDR